MNHHANQALDKIEQYLKIYEVEPLGQILVDRLRLSKTVIFSIFVFLYFGILLALHNMAGHVPPATFKELFSHPTSRYYYPNLIGITYDLIGNPLLFVYLAVIRHFVPHQFMKLEQDGLIKARLPLSRLTRLAQSINSNRPTQIIIVTILPLIISLLLAIQSINVYQPADTPARYAIFLSFLGTYARLVIVVQLIQILVILRSYSFNLKLNLSHPDSCSGLAPFGHLAIIIYAFLFFSALFLAIGTSAGGSALERTITSATGSFTLIYLWLLFPLVSIYIFEQLVNRPHQALVKLQREYLESFSQAWTEYHKNILSALQKSVETSKSSLFKKRNYNFSGDLELLQTWAKLEEHIANMHTWPISKSTFRILATIVNPLIPILFPVIVGVVESLLL